MKVEPADFQAFFEQLPGRHVVFAPDLTILAASEEWFAAVQRRPSEVIGRHVFDLFPDNPGDAAANGGLALRQVLDRVLTAGETVRWGPQRYDVQRPDGTFEERYWQSVTRPVRDAAGKVVAAIRRIDEVTERVRQERELSLLLAARARAEEQLRDQERRHRFLLTLGDAVRQLVDPTAIMAAAASAIGRELEVGQVAYCEVDPVHGVAIIEQDWNDGSIASVAGRHVMDNFSSGFIAALRRGETVAIRQVADDPRTEVTAVREAFARLGIASVLNVPLVKDGNVVAILALHQRSERSWNDFEVSLAEEVAERTWAAVERARAEAALRESEARYRLLFDSIADGFCVVEALFDADGRPQDYRFLQANPAFAEHTGLRNALGRTALEMLPDLDRWWIQTYCEVARTGESARFQNHAAAMGRWFDVYAFRFGDPAQRQVAIFFTDITERKRAEAELRTSEERLSEVFQRAPSFMCILRGPQHVFERANDRYYQLVGHRKIIGLPARQALPEVEGQGFFELLDQVYQSGEPLVSRETTLLLQRQPGDELEERVVEFVYQPVRDTQGVVNGILAQGIDLTERRLAEAAVRESQEQLRLILANVQDHAIFTIDLTGQVTTWNVGAERIFGFTAEEMIGRSASILFTPEDRERSQDIQEMDTAMRDGVAADERYHVRQDGSRFFASGSMEALRDVSGNLRGFVKVVRDITEERAMAEQREHLLQVERAARTEAERVGRMKDEFLATLSHELRTPLSAILGWAQILLQEAERDPATVAEGVAAIERNARAQARLIEDLLDMSRIISGKTRLDVKPVDLAAVIAAAFDAVRPAAEAKHIQLLRTLDTPPPPVTGDPGRLQQVFWNLLANAIKFTPRGGRVQVVLERVESQVVIRVIDSGEGIAAEFLPYVFEPFRQADASITRMHSGLGLGLAIVKHLVELHGGRVAVASEGEGQGAVFSVSLPLSNLRPQSPGVAPAVEAPGRINAARSPAAKRALIGLRILLVDDEADARRLMGQFLTARGALVELADSAAAALASVDRAPPDVVVSDIGLPRVDGYDLMQQIRTRPAQAGGAVPAIALTAFARSEDRQRALRAGYQLHLAKPVEPDELILAIQSLVPRSAAGDGARG